MTRSTLWSVEASQVHDGHNDRQVFDMAKGLTSGTELNRFDEAGEAALGKSSSKKSVLSVEIIR